MLCNMRVSTVYLCHKKSQQKKEKFAVKITTIEPEDQGTVAPHEVAIAGMLLTADSKERDDNLGTLCQRQCLVSDLPTDAWRIPAGLHQEECHQEDGYTPHHP